MFTSSAVRAFWLHSSDIEELPRLRDKDGFLDPSLPMQKVAAGARAGDLVAGSAVCDAPSLIVLGEPGQGKTFALRQIERDLQNRDDDVLWIVGSDVNESTFDAEFAPATSQMSPERPEHARRLAIIVDGLDESPMIANFARRLQRKLAGLNSSRYRIIVGCRTADLPSGLVAALGSFTGQPPWVCDLAPLTRTQATALVDDEGLNGAALVGDAVSRGGGVLASVPLTLRLLLDTFRRGGSLPETARELFELGATALLDVAGGFGSGSISTADERRAIAERIAAVMILSGKRTIHVGPVLNATEQDLRIGEVVDGTERTGGGEFAVTQDLVRETLGTAMFSWRGSDRCTFSHSSHAALLAATYLANRETAVPRPQLVGLLLVAAPDGAQTVPTPLREIATWLGVIDERIGRWLAKIDPTTLIGHESYISSDALRSCVVDQLFDVAGEFELAERYWRDINLEHAGLAARIVEELAPFAVQPTDWDEFARCRLALRLSAFTKSDPLGERLLEIARSSAWNTHLGSLAVDALLRQGDRYVEPLAELLDELRLPAFARVRDPDDELRGHLLSGLWPRYVATSRILPVLGPRGSDLIGSYWLFLRQFAERVSSNELPEVMAWASDRASTQRTAVGETVVDQHLGDLPVGMLDSDLADGLVRRALVDDRVSEYLNHVAAVSWPRLQRFDRGCLPSSITADVRRGLAESLLRHRGGSERLRADVWHIISAWDCTNDEEGLPRRTGLLDSDDFEWAIERAKAMAKQELAMVEPFIELTQMLFKASNSRRGTRIRPSRHGAMAGLRAMVRSGRDPRRSG